MKDSVPLYNDDRPTFPFHCPTLKYASGYMNAIFAVTHQPQIYISEPIINFNERKQNMTMQLQCSNYDNEQ